MQPGEGGERGAGGGGAEQPVLPPPTSRGEVLQQQREPAVDRLRPRDKEANGRVLSNGVIKVSRSDLQISLWTACALATGIPAATSCPHAAEPRNSASTV